jgi:hypothetical protein
MQEECGKNWKLQDEMQGGLSRATSPTTQSCGGDADSPRFEDELERRMAAYDAGQTTADNWEMVREGLQQVLKERGARDRV